jgi:hypothetical protein
MKFRFFVSQLMVVTSQKVWYLDNSHLKLLAPNRKNTVLTAEGSAVVIRYQMEAHFMV